MEQLDLPLACDGSSISHYFNIYTNTDQEYPDLECSVEFIKDKPVYNEGLLCMYVLNGGWSGLLDINRKLIYVGSLQNRSIPFKRIEWN